jgi:hypothetical protein
MTVEILRLTGLRGDEGDQAASALLADYRSHPDLSRLLVIDDTIALIGHSAAYERLLTSRRLDHLLCVAVGPRAADNREFRFPGNIGGGQGSAVLWVSEPHGIDWRLAASAIAVGHSGNSASGLHHLIELLSVDEVFDRVCEIAKRVPGGVANPGLRLAGADNEAARFAAALVMAIRRLTRPASGPAPVENSLFTALQGVRPGSASLAEDGELSRYREDVVTSAASASDALTQLAGIGGLLGLSQPSVRTHVISAGSALGAFRERVARLLRDAHAPSGLSEKQRGQLKAAGVRLLDPSPAIADGVTGAGAVGGTGGGATGTGSGRSAVYGAIAEAVRGGDSLPRVTRRLNLTATALDHGGSASYRPEVDQVCPPSLVRRLAEPPSPPRPPRWWLPTAGALAAVLGALAAGWSVAAGVAVGGLALVIMVAAAVWPWRARVSAWRRQLALDEAVHSADALADLVATVAAREWSGGNLILDEITRIRIALDGVTRQLTEHADAAGDPGGGARASRAARLSESLISGLRDLVLAVLAAGSATASAIGQAAFEQARAKTAQLVTDWTEYARTHGALARPPFATFTANDVPYADEGEMAEITEAVQHDPREVMWQLCTPTDLSALDVADAPQVVAFAPRLTKPSLAEVLPPDTVWTSSGAHAGLLRLVPLRAGIASPSWTADERHLEPPL